MNQISIVKLIKTERMKLKRSPLWIAFILMPIIPAILGSANYMNNLEILTEEWYSLWTQHTLFTCYFFLPILIGIYCSYLMWQENKNHNWNKVLSMPVSKGRIFIAKLVCASYMILLSEIWICVLFVLSGKFIGLTSPIPLDRLIIWCLFGTLGGAVMAAAQLLLSLFIRSFAPPVGISLCGGLTGLVALAKDFGHIWPYSLMSYGMNSNAPQELNQTGYIPFIITCVLYIAAITFISGSILSKRDI